MQAPTTMLFRPADEPNPQVWDLPVEFGIFPSSEVESRVSEGWFRHPHDVTATAEPEPKRRGRPPKEAP